MQLYQNHSSDPKTDAQRNLCGRTHYVDDDTLRYHKSRVISSQHTDNGLLFAIITSDALDYQNHKRGFRYVIFDIFGRTIARPRLEEAFRTSAQASKAMWHALNSFDAIALTNEAIARETRQHAEEMHQLAGEVAKIAAIDQAA
jgi:hypothetical protein